MREAKLHGMYSIWLGVLTICFQFGYVFEYIFSLLEYDEIITQLIFKPKKDAL